MDNFKITHTFIRGLHQLCDLSVESLYRSRICHTVYYTPQKSPFDGHQRQTAEFCDCDLLRQALIHFR
jgi:hypothetical protein